MVKVPKNLKKKNVIIRSADGHRKGKEGSSDEGTSGSGQVKECSQLRVMGTTDPDK